ncbi:MAG: heavy metal-associated domain-containing protein [Cellulosimicrobium cellulans]
MRTISSVWVHGWKGPPADPGGTGRRESGRLLILLIFRPPCSPGIGHNGPRSTTVYGLYSGDRPCAIIPLGGMLLLLLVTWFVQASEAITAVHPQQSCLHLFSEGKTDMCGTSESRTQLPLANAAEHGCGCCSPAADTRTGAVATAQPQGSGAQYSLKGLTCGHCVQTVEKAVSGVSGVHSASVDLVPGGTSRLNVTGTHDPDALAAAIRSAGYALAGAN